MRFVAAFILALLFGFFITVVMAVLFAFPIKWLWNYAMTDVLGFRQIDFSHAWALGMLCGLLFKSTSVSPKST